MFKQTKCVVRTVYSLQIHSKYSSNSANILVESENFEIMKIFKPNQKQTLVVFMEPPEHASNISLKGGNMILIDCVSTKTLLLNYLEFFISKNRFIKLKLAMTVRTNSNKKKKEWSNHSYAQTSILKFT